MGMIGDLFGVFFGSGRNALRETVEVFRPNAEAEAERASTRDIAVLAQFATEFTHTQRGPFDRLIDGVNRLPRPALAFGTLALFVAAMVDPVWFAARMTGLAVVPDPLWWLMGAIVSFYFGARHQAKAQDFQRSVLEAAAKVPGTIERIGALLPEPVQARARGPVDTTDNAALADWVASRES